MEWMGGFNTGNTKYQQMKWLKNKKIKNKLEIVLIQ